MNKLAVGLGTAVATVAAAAVWIQHEDNAALRSEIALLRGEVQELASVSPVAAKPNATRLRAAASEAGGTSSVELAQLHDDIAALRKNTQQVVEFVQMAQAAVAMKEMSNVGSDAPVKLTPAGDLKNLGNQTPDTAVQTTLWAAVAGDVDALATGFAFTPAGRAKADAWFASLSEGTRQKYGSPEKIIALMVARDAAGLAGMQVLGQKEISSSDVGVRVRFANGDGQTKDDNVVMHRVGTDWKMLLSDTTVQKFAKKLGGGK